MGRRLSENRKGQNVIIRNFSECQRSYINEIANIESIRSGRMVSISAVVAKIVREKMNSEGVTCTVE